MQLTGGRTAGDIVQWLKKRTGPPATALDSVEACKKFADGNEVAVIGYFQDESSDKATAYINTADADDSVSYGIVTSKDIAKGMETEQDSIIVYKKFDDGRAVFSGDWTTEAILTFVAGEQLPLVTKFSDEVGVMFLRAFVRISIELYNSFRLPQRYSEVSSKLTCWLSSPEKMRAFLQL